MPIQLQLSDYYRMECATVPCPACGAQRGEGCIGKNVARYVGSGHSERKSAFRRWAKRNREQYTRLRRQVELLAESRCDPKTNDLYMGEN